MSTHTLGPQPYVRWGMSRDARQLLDRVCWLDHMHEMGCAADHPDFNPAHPRSTARELRELAAKIIGAAT